MGRRPTSVSWLNQLEIWSRPTSVSWLNQLEIWFNIITQRAIRRGTFRSVRDLVEKIDRFVREYNRRCRPFVWTATPDAIFETLERICKAVAGTGHSSFPSLIGVSNSATFIERPWRTFEYWLRCFDRLRPSVAWRGPSANSVATVAAAMPTAAVAAAMPTAAVTAAMPTATVATAMPTPTLATAVAAARVPGTGVARAVRAEMASRAMSAIRMASSVVSTHEMSAARVVPTAVGRRVPDGVSAVVSADEVIAYPMEPVRPVRQDRGPEVRKHSVPVVEAVVSGRIRTSRDVYDAIVPVAGRIRSLQQITNDLVADALLPEQGDRLRVEREFDLARVEEDQGRLIRNAALCQQRQVFQ